MTQPNAATNFTDLVKQAEGLWVAARYAEAEQLLTAAIEAAIGAADVEAEAQLRVARATTYKYRNASTRAFADVERVLALSGTSTGVAERARTLALSLSYELRLFDVVERLAGERIPDLRFLAISQFRSGQHDAGERTYARIIALAERQGDQVIALRSRCERAMWGDADVPWRRSRRECRSCCARGVPTVRWRARRDRY